MGLWQKFKQGLQKTSDKLETVFRFTKLDDDALENLEEGLILSDMGAGVSAKLVGEMAKRKPQSVELCHRRTGRLKLTGHKNRL